MHDPIYRIVHTMVFVTPVVEHWLEREIVQWVHMRGRSKYELHFVCERVFVCVCVCACT